MSGPSRGSRWLRVILREPPLPDRAKVGLFALGTARPRTPARIPAARMRALCRADARARARTLNPPARPQLHRVRCKPVEPDAPVTGSHPPARAPRRSALLLRRRAHGRPSKDAPSTPKRAPSTSKRAPSAPKGRPATHDSRRFGVEGRDVVLEARSVGAEARRIDPRPCSLRRRPCSLRRPRSALRGPVRMSSRRACQEVCAFAVSRVATFIRSGPKTATRPVAHALDSSEPRADCRRGSSIGVY
jgi:hypothetical protein